MNTTYWTIDGVDIKFDTLAEAKNHVRGLDNDGWQWIMKKTNGKCAIRRWYKGKEVSFVVVQGKSGFTRTEKTTTAKKYYFYFMPIQHI